MSLRYASRVFYQAGMRVMQGVKEQASKCTTESSNLNLNLRSLKDSATASSSSSKQARRLSNAVVDSGALKSANNDRLKHAEESLRTIMYLSCWGPN